MTGPNLSTSSEDALEAALATLRASPYHELAWGTLYRTLWPHVIAAAFQTLGGNTDAAEDVAQAVFLRLLENSTFVQFENVQMLRAYMHRMARNRAIDWLRKDTRQVPLSSDGVELESDVLADADPVTDLKAELGGAVESLSESDRGLLHLLIDGYSFQEISQQLGISTPTLRVRIHRLRTRLRERMPLEEDDG